MLWNPDYVLLTVNTAMRGKERAKAPWLFLGPDTHMSMPPIPPIPPIPPGGAGGPPDLLEAMTSSILRIMDAASVADFMTCSLTASGSTTSIFDMSVILAF